MSDLDWAYGQVDAGLQSLVERNAVVRRMWYAMLREHANQLAARHFGASRPRYYFWLGSDG